MAQNDIDDVLDHLRRIKSGGDQSSIKIDQIEILEMELRLLRTSIKYHHVLLPDSLVKLTKKAKLIVEMLVFSGILDECKTNLNVERLVSQLLKFTEGNTSSICNFELNDSDLSEYMDCMEKNLNDVLMCLESGRYDPYFYNQALKQVKIIQKKIRFLRYLYDTEINGYVDYEKLEGLEILIQFMADNVGQFCLDVSINVAEFEDDTCEDEDDTDEDEDDTDDDEDDMWDKPSYLICLIVLVELEMKKIFLGELKASKFTQSRTFKEKKLPKGFSHHLHSLMMYLRNKKLENFPNNMSAQNIDVAIEFLLIFLVDVSNHVINDKKLNEVLVKVGAIAGDVLYVIQKLLHSSINKDDSSKISLCSIQILEKTKDLKAQVETHYKFLKFTPSQFPSVGGLSFVDSFLRKLNEMSKSNLEKELSSLTSILEKDLSSLASILEKELSSLSSIFRDVAKVHHEHKILEDLQRRTINLAYEAEVAIDSILAQYNALSHLFCSLPTIIKEINHINVEVAELRSGDLSLRPCSIVEEIVGFETAAEKLIQYLTRGTSELDVIPIVGMGGQGKTTIARQVYNNDIIVSHFDVRAWCIISQTYNRRELLPEIFSQVTSSKDKGDKDDILADKLRKSLMRKRYLIVLDDMWDSMAWNDLRLCFPDVGNRSRIVVTTRLKKVAKQVKHHTDPYYLPFLTPDESCKLLQKKVFLTKDCPPELQDVSLAVAERCKGLPLVVVLVAGIIKRKKMEASWWHELKNSLLFSLGEAEGYSLSTMQLSYDNLPDHLRPCLLYMGMFPEDARIPVSKLISLWIAEGFVQNIESGRLMEEIAEDYLMDLISSNVIMVSKREYNGKVKYCQVHDVVLHFCLEKSREEKFMLAVKGNRSQFQPSDWKESRVSFSFSNELSKFASLGSKSQKIFHQHLRSLITTNEGEYNYWNPFRQVREVRLLKVLDLSSQPVIDFSSATLKPLFHLKYLAVYTNKFDFHPESHLLRLETLIVNCFYPEHTLVPAIFWTMEKLRHVEISNAIFDLENNKQGIFKESSKLKNLRILRGVDLDNNSADVLLGRCPNLQELDISFWDDKDRYFAMESLTQLQSLRLFFSSSLVVSKLQLPSNLKKLKLVQRGTNIESMISFIAGLPSLEYLKLRDFAQSKEWCLEDIKFHKLKFLKLSNLAISRWDASEESFPLLETLVINGCDELEEIPLSFADIPTMKQIKLIDCYESLKASAVQIKKAVEDTEGNDRIDLIIKDG